MRRPHYAPMGALYVLLLAAIITLGFCGCSSTSEARKPEPVTYKIDRGGARFIVYSDSTLSLLLPRTANDGSRSLEFYHRDEHVMTVRIGFVCRYVNKDLIVQRPCGEMSRYRDAERVPECRLKIGTLAEQVVPCEYAVMQGRAAYQQMNHLLERARRLLKQKRVLRA